MGSVPPDLTRDLLRLLRREMSLYRDLLGLLRKEKEALLKHALLDLSETNRLKRPLIADLRRAEAERQDIVLRLAAALGLPAEAVTLSKVIASLEERESADLSECGATLASVLSLCQEIGRENAILLEHSFDLVGSLLSSFAEQSVGHFTYLPTGAFQGGAVSGHLVERRA